MAEEAGPAAAAQPGRSRRELREQQRALRVTINVHECKTQYSITRSSCGDPWKCPGCHRQYRGANQMGRHARQCTALATFVELEGYGGVDAPMIVLAEARLHWVSTLRLLICTHCHVGIDYRKHLVPTGCPHARTVATLDNARAVLHTLEPRPLKPVEAARAVQELEYEYDLLPPAQEGVRCSTCEFAAATATEFAVHARQASLTEGHEPVECKVQRFNRRSRWLPIGHLPPRVPNTIVRQERVEAEAIDVSAFYRESSLTVEYVGTLRLTGSHQTDGHILSPSPMPATHAEAAATTVSIFLYPVG